MSASLANCLSARCLLTGPNRWKSLGMKMRLQGPPNHTTTTSHKSRWQWMRIVIVCEVPWPSACSLYLVIQPVTDNFVQTTKWNVQHSGNIRQPHLSVLWYWQDTPFTLDEPGGHGCSLKLASFLSLLEAMHHNHTYFYDNTHSQYTSTKWQ